MLLLSELYKYKVLKKDYCDLVSKKLTINCKNDKRSGFKKMGDYKIVNAKHDRSYQKKQFNDKSLDR